MTLGLCKKGLGCSLRGPSLGQATYIQACERELEKPVPSLPRVRIWPESFVIRVRNFILLNTTFDPSNLI